LLVLVKFYRTGRRVKRKVGGTVAQWRPLNPDATARLIILIAASRGYWRKD